MTKKCLTGKELREAAQNKIPVRYVCHYFDPTDEDIDWVGVMKKVSIGGSHGYYIGDADIDPDDYKDDELVSGEFPEGHFGVYPVERVKYFINERVMVRASYPVNPQPNWIEARIFSTEKNGDVLVNLIAIDVGRTLGPDDYDQILKWEQVEEILDAAMED